MNPIHNTVKEERFSLKKALITGITGQDGSFLAELLLDKGYEVHGIIRRASTFNTSRINHLYKDPLREETRLFLHYGDLMDASSLRQVLSQVMPDEVYNLAAQSHVKVSFEQPVYTVDSDAVGSVRMLDAIRDIIQHTGKSIRYYQASSSEMFGGSSPPQSETTPFYPKSPYGAAKVCAYWLTVNARESYDMFACNGILFNHESERRGETFVTRKITRAATRIKLGLQDKLVLGNLEAERDWGFAGDYVEAMWRMLQAETPEDYVIATGKSYSVRHFVERTFQKLDLDYEASIELSDRYRRPAEVDALLGDARKAKANLGWEPTYNLEMLIDRMLQYDLQLAEQEKLLLDTHGTVSMGGAYR
jgi:GDPmannose 4,6-dehydratase